MPQKKKNSTKKNPPRKNKPNKASKRSNKQHDAKSPSNTKTQTHEGQAFSKELRPLLNHLSMVLREIDQSGGKLKGLPLYQTCVKLDELCDQIITLQSGFKEQIESNPKLWGFEDTENADSQTLLDRFTLWIKKEQSDSFIGDKFEFKDNLIEGRGVIATEDLKQGEHAMSIHRKLMMTYSHCINKSDDKIRRFLKKDPLCQLLIHSFIQIFISSFCAFHKIGESNHWHLSSLFGTNE